ncbi:MAG: type II secretion system F family protein [Actinomycetes bacterium]|jgi:tight adherence protein B
MIRKGEKLSIKRSQLLLSALAGFVLADLVIGSAVLALPIAALSPALPLFLQKRRAQRRQAQLAGLWPELLDHMISGLRSGLSIAETLAGLAIRGPEISRPIFKECQALLRSGSDIERVFQYIKVEFNDPVADQVCEVLDFARGTGSRDTAITLRTLGDFIRSDIAVRGEIDAKLGWVKNSAVVAAIAPWILLVILSTQPSTLQAFSTGTGNLILLLGIALSAIAYLWMSRVGRVQGIPRIFLEESA